MHGRTCVGIDKRTEEETYARTYGWTDGQSDRHTYGQMDEGTGGGTYAGSDGWTKVRMPIG